jgi:hypothetical protein
MSGILYPLPKIVKNFNTIVFMGGTTILHPVADHCGQATSGYFVETGVAISVAPTSGSA